MSHCSPAKSTSPANFKPKAATDGEYEAAKHLPYPQIVGSLLYAAVITRPDIAHTVSVLSRYLAKWSDSHYHAAKHLLRYIRGTSDLCLVMDGTAGSRILQGYADADWGGDSDTQRSTTGYIFQVYGSTACWKSRLQQTVALSAMDAELQASSDATRHAIWLKKLSADLDLDASTISIINDNNGAMSLTKNPNNFDKSKHFDICQNFVREKVEDNIVSLDKVSPKRTQRISSPSLLLRSRLRTCATNSDSPNDRRNSKASKAAKADYVRVATLSLRHNTEKIPRLNSP